MSVLAMTIGFAYQYVFVPICCKKQICGTKCQSYRRDILFCIDGHVIKQAGHTVLHRWTCN